LRPVDVADQPVLLEAAGAKLMLSLPVSQTSVTTGLNAGSKVQLCGKSPFSYGSVTVQAVRCELGSPNTPCTALVDLIRNIRRIGISIIWIEHIVHALIAVVDRLLVLYGGGFIGEGAPQAVIASPAVREIYMGIPADA